MTKNILSFKTIYSKKKYMKKFFILLMLFVLTSFSECNFKGNQTNTNDGYTETILGQSRPQMILGEEREITQFQIDSICEADTLPMFNEWLFTQFMDNETREVFTKHMCIKYEKNKETVYTITIDKESPYPYVKRITYK